MNTLYVWIDSLWQWISKTVFVRFEFDIPVEQLKEAEAKGKLTFALTTGGMIEWLILSSWCRSQGLGAILVANRKRILLLAKPKYFFQILFRQRSYADLFLSNQEGPRLLFVPTHERKKPFDPTPVERLIAQIYTEEATSGTASEFCLVPIFIRWRKHVRGAARKPSEFLFGLSSNPNLIGKIWYLLRARMDSTVRALAPFNLTQRESIEAGGSLEETEAGKIARSTRRKVLVLINQEMRVVLGPRYLSPHSVKEMLMRDPDIQQMALEAAEKEGIDKKKAMLRVYQYLTEIVAHYTFRFIEVMYVVLTWLFTRVFDGLVTQESELQRVRETMKTKPVVFVSCHRSHLDYLVVPYVLFVEDMVTPHIAAGVNLSFWPLGPFLRMGGAFFIRRSFRGNPLYQLVLKKYIEYLLKNRYNIKFFIEGTRSRSGKMLPPAYGLLKMVLESYRVHAVDDIALIPVSICYDEVLEEGSYSKELSGEQKQKESARGLLQSRKLIKRNIGKVYVHFAEPLFAKDVYQSAEQAGVDPTLMLQKTAFQISKNINDVSPITPKSIVCSIFLAHPASALAVEDLLRLSVDMGRYVAFSGMLLSVPLGDGFKRAIEQTLRALQKSGRITLQDGVPRRFARDPKRRIALNFYKNNAIHCFVIPAITLLAFADAKASQRKGRFYDEFVQSAVRLRNVLKFEFFFSPTPQFIEAIHKTFSFFAGEKNWQEEKALAWSGSLQEHGGSAEDLSVYLRLLGELVESYLIACSYLKENQNSSHEKKLLLPKIVKFAESKTDENAPEFPEAISTQDFANALMLFENLEFVKIEKVEDKVMVNVKGWNAAMADLEAQLRKLLTLMNRDPNEVLF